MEIELPDLLNIVPDLVQRPMSATLQAEHSADLAQRDLYADSGQETDQHRARQEVRHEAQADNPCQNQKTRRHEGQNRGRATNSSVPVDAIPIGPAERVAAVAESAPTTRCREDPKIANSAIGIKMV